MSDPNTIRGKSMFSEALEHLESISEMIDRFRWKPIEGIPEELKDGRDLLIKNRTGYVVVGYYIEGEWWYADHHTIRPTHWMLVP